MYLYIFFAFVWLISLQRAPNIWNVQHDWSALIFWVNQSIRYGNYIKFNCNQSFMEGPSFKSSGSISSRRAAWGVKPQHILTYVWYKVLRGLRCVADLGRWMIPFSSGNKIVELQPQRVWELSLASFSARYFSIVSSLGPLVLNCTGWSADTIAVETNFYLLPPTTL